LAIERVDLGVCGGYDYDGDAARTAIVLPGRMLAGMPVNAYAIEGLRRHGLRVVQVWDEVLDDSVDPTTWVVDRAQAAVRYAGACSVVVGKSLGTRAAGFAADNGWPGIWLTPLLRDDETIGMLRRRTAAALLIGGTEDEAWDGALARELSPDVLELPGADHGLAKIEHLQAIVDAVAAFAARLERLAVE
jgi:hypothetical protein